MFAKEDVLRGACKGCGKCDDYECRNYPDDKNCVNCSCPPTKHEKKSRSNGTFKGLSGLIKGVHSFHVLQGYKYVIKYSSTGSSVVRVIDATLKGKNSKNWIFRVDKPHGAKVPFEHMNINPKMSGLAKDPHVRLPTGSTQFAKGTAKTVEVLNKLNKVAVPLAVAVECAVIGKSVYDDVQNGTTRNSVEAVTQSVGGWTGGFGGGLAGASIGTAILPGIGTIIGGIVGSVGGGIGGSLGVGVAVEKIGDICDFGMVESKCEECSKLFKNRKYKGENRKYCEDCSDFLTEIHLECETCNEKFSVEKFDNEKDLRYEFFHDRCPSKNKDQVKSDEKIILDKFIEIECFKCQSVFKTRICSVDINANICHSCFYEMSFGKRESNDSILDIINLACEHCRESIFLLISEDVVGSEFRHKYCRKKT